MAKLFVNSRDPDQTPRFVASDLSLRCLPIIRFDYNGLKARQLYLGYIR